MERAGATVVMHEHVPDHAGTTLAALGAALDEADVVLVSGGVSVGPHDHVKDAFAHQGTEERFWGVSLRPGKPTWFGTKGETLAFGLPGNPVSAMVTFQLFVRPALAALQGADPGITRTTARARRGRSSATGSASRRCGCGCATGDDGWQASPTKDAQGSHVLTSMLGADGLALIAPGDGDAPVGELVEVELL